MFPKDDMPREKLLKNGPECLTDTELLAIILRTGTIESNVLEFSSKLLSTFGGLEGLCKATPQELMQERGIKESKATMMAAVFELGRRISLINSLDREDWQLAVEKIAVETQFEEREFIFALFLDIKEKVIYTDKISYGGLSGAHMDLPVFFRKAVRLNAYSIMLLHNHPNGADFPSREDIVLTEHVEGALKLLGIKLKAHCILAKGKVVKI
ncbi:MAG: DNA repair protein RadC [Synergistaceae bacterium]